MDKNLCNSKDFMAKLTFLEGENPDQSQHHRYNVLFTAGEALYRTGVMATSVKAAGAKVLHLIEKHFSFEGELALFGAMRVRGKKWEAQTLTAEGLVGSLDYMGSLAF